MFPLPRRVCGTEISVVFQIALSEQDCQLRLYVPTIDTLSISGFGAKPKIATCSEVITLLFPEGEVILGDFGQDGIPNTNDPGEGDGILEPIDANELDGDYDTGDGCFGCEGDTDQEMYQKLINQN